MTFVIFSSSSFAVFSTRLPPASFALPPQAPTPQLFSTYPFLPQSEYVFYPSVTFDCANARSNRPTYLPASQNTLLANNPPPPRPQQPRHSSPQPAPPAPPSASPPPRPPPCPPPGQLPHPPPGPTHPTIPSPCSEAQPASLPLATVLHAASAPAWQDDAVPSLLAPAQVYVHMCLTIYLYSPFSNPPPSPSFSLHFPFLYPPPTSFSLSITSFLYTNWPPPFFVLPSHNTDLAHWRRLQSWQSTTGVLHCALLLVTGITAW